MNLSEDEERLIEFYDEKLNDLDFDFIDFTFVDILVKAVDISSRDNSLGWRTCRVHAIWKLLEGCSELDYSFELSKKIDNELSGCPAREFEYYTLFRKCRDEVMKDLQSLCNSVLFDGSKSYE